MIFSPIFALALFLLTHVAHALPPAELNTRSTTVRATFDYNYDNPSGSLNGVACSNGDHGLAAKYPMFSDLPTFPYIGGVPGASWGSPKCGGCWKLTSTTTGYWIFFTAVDGTATFNLAQPAFKALNGGQIGQGVMDLIAQEVPRSFCGLSP